MHHSVHPDWNRYTIYLCAAIFVLVVAWLVAGRRVDPPPDKTARTSFTSSWFLPLFFAGFSLCMALAPLVMGVDFLFLETDANIGGHWIRLSVGSFVLLWGLFFCFGVKVFGKQALWPNRLTVDATGVRGRIGGRARQWVWGEIQDVAIAPGRPDVADVLLMLRHDDPDLVRHFQRLHWLPWAKRANVRRVSLGCQWKPVAMKMSGQQAVYLAIRQGLDQFGGRQPMTAQLSG